MTFTKLPKAITAEELLSTPLPPVKWIIPGLLPAGLALFAGPSKAGKSWLTLWLCLQVAQDVYKRQPHARIKQRKYRKSPEDLTKSVRFSGLFFLSGKCIQMEYTRCV